MMGLTSELTARDFSFGLVCILANSPKNTRRVVEAEVPHAPWLFFKVGDLDTILRKNAAGVYMIPPGIHVFDEDVHHEILSDRLCAEILQQEAHVTKVEIGNAASFRGHRKTEVLVELLGNLEVL